MSETKTEAAMWIRETVQNGIDSCRDALLEAIAKLAADVEAGCRFDYGAVERVARLEIRLHELLRLQRWVTGNDGADLVDGYVADLEKTLMRFSGGRSTSTWSNAASETEQTVRQELMFLARTWLARMHRAV